MIDSEARMETEFLESQKVERASIIKEFQSILALSNEMPPMSDDENKSKASSTDAEYYSYKVLGSVFNSVRNALRSIYSRSLVSSSAALEQIKEDENTINEINSARAGLRETMGAYGKTGREILIALNKMGPSEVEELDVILKRTIQVLEQENKQ
jgi:hypothetical protein